MLTITLFLSLRDPSLILHRIVKGFIDMTPFKEIFEREYTWIAGFMRNVFRYPQKDAMISPSLGRKWSYNELNEDANRLANAFKNS